MTRMTGPDCVVMCNLINTHTHTHTHTHVNQVALPAHHHPGSDRVISECLSCKGVILVEERGHSPPPPHFSWGPGNLSLSYVLCTWPAIPRNLSLSYVLCTWPAIPNNLSLFYVLCTWSAIPRNLSLLYLLVVASSSSPLFSVGVGPMSVLSIQF